MREIKFRGYAVEEMVGSQWICGTGIYKTTFTDEYAKETGRKHEYLIFTESGWIEVYGESIGQFIGLVDKNGDEICEGHIVRYKDADGAIRTGVVVFKYGSFAIETPYMTSFRLIDYSIEIIGNSYENN